MDQIALLIDQIFQSNEPVNKQKLGNDIVFHNIVNRIQIQGEKDGSFKIDNTDDFIF